MLSFKLIQPFYVLWQLFFLFLRIISSLVFYHGFNFDEFSGDKFSLLWLILLFMHSVCVCVYAGVCVHIFYLFSSPFFNFHSASNMLCLNESNLILLWRLIHTYIYIKYIHYKRNITNEWMNDECQILNLFMHGNGFLFTINWCRYKKFHWKI